MAIYREAEYRKRFIGNSKVLVNPKAFVHFVKKELKPRVLILKNGSYAGLVNFVMEVRPAYMMYV
jgi:hypothetical protein